MTLQNSVEESATTLERIVRALVAEKREVTVSTRSSIENNSAVFTVRVHDRDLGKVVGRHGRTARSLRILFGAIGNEAGGSFVLDIQAHAMSDRRM